MRRGLPPRRFSVFSFQFLAVIFLVIAFAFGYWQWQVGRFGKFDRFNLVVAGRPVTLVSLDWKAKAATVVTFPDELFVSPVVPNYGGYRISSVYSVGQLDGRGGEVLSWTVSEFLGVPVDGFLVIDKRIGSPVKNFFLDPEIFRAKSDRNFFDRARFVWSLSQVRFDRIKTIDLGALAQPLLLADGSKALSVDKEQLDNQLAGDFAESRVGEEASRVEVVNTTSVLGLGGRVARLLGNVGVTVVGVSSLEGKLARCEVRAEKKNLVGVTAQRIAQIYSCGLLEQAGEGRADVTIFLGEDWATRFRQ